MIRNLFLIMLAAFYCSMAYGVRAYPHPKKVVQPDGTVITIVGHGDEFSHHIATLDGYTVVKCHDGFYRYAVEEGGRIKPSGMKASDADRRSASEKDFLCSVEPGLKSSVSAVGRRLMGLSAKNDGMFSHGVSAPASYRRVAGKNTEKNPYRGLVILVNFTDRKFSRGDMSAKLVDDMMNKPGYTSYVDPLLNGRIDCTGSVRDYFDDNSGGLFVPEFDVVGPVEVDVNQYYIMTTDRTYELCAKVLEAADPYVDFTRYDSDGDGAVDMLYVLYAGYSSQYQDNDERLVWPHAGHFEDADVMPVHDGMRFGRFACSAEIFGWHDDGDIFLDGIGVIVHEFSHVLGFKDHYDVSGYLNEDPGIWDVMAAGNYNGQLNDTPCGYNSYEKYAAGFISPKTVDMGDAGEVVNLRALSSSDEALRICSTQDSVVFMVENRQFEKWDRYLPGHGMLVWRVDSCDSEYWKHNALNVNGRLHFKLIRANGATKTLFQEIEDKDYDPFPGSRNVRDLTNRSIESDLLTTDGYPSPFVLNDIAEENGIISFTINEDVDATDKPYTFTLCDSYSASGIMTDDAALSWDVRTGVLTVGTREVPVIYDLIPDVTGIAASDPKYADGLAAAYSLSGDRSKVYIEPYRVALTEDYGVWLVDFNDLDNGGSGAIVLNMNPYGDISLSNPESVLGYCLMPRKSPLVVPENIVERLSEFRNIVFGSPSGVESIASKDMVGQNDGTVYNLQGMKVSNPKQGEIYVVNGRKIVFK